METRGAGVITEEMLPPVVRYREYRPTGALRDIVRSIFTFSAPDPNEPRAHDVKREVLFHAKDSFCSPVFADGAASVVFSFPRVCKNGSGFWRDSSEPPRGDWIGPMTKARSEAQDARPEMVGVYLRAGGASRLMRLSPAELTDRIIPLNDLWGRSSLADKLNASTEAERVEWLESTLLGAIVSHRSTQINIAGLTNVALRAQGQITIHAMAEAAGVSRQRLTRVFRENVGVCPKMFCRIARFQATLGIEPKASWAQVAAEMGYADQSHMIAEFRQFSSLTPQSLVEGRWFHPFIERARKFRPPENSVSLIRAHFPPGKFRQPDPAPFSVTSFQVDNKRGFSRSTYLQSLRNGGGSG